ncbi:MAG: iron-containing alcohol dehydrogenase family protein [Chloroflexota bacterium]
MTDPFTFSAPTEILAGPGSLSQLGELAARFSPSNIALVCDEGVAAAGLLDLALHQLTAVNVNLCTLVFPDPTTDDVEAIACEAIEHGSDLVIAMGGGSGLAAGKAVALRLTNHRPVTAYAGRDQAEALPAPSIAIPTTAGSGSEVSNALVLHDPERPMVLVVRGRGYEPNIAILDGTLIATLPRTPFIYAALDALSHALEALWVRKANPFTDAMAYHAADLIYGALVRALERRQPDDLQTLLEASAMANIACGNSELGLVHALSLSTAVRLAHGHQNAVLMPYVAEFNRAEVAPRTAALLDGILPLYQSLHFDPHFQPGELDAPVAESMVGVALKVPLTANNIRQANETDLRSLLALTGAPIAATNLAS